MLNNSDVSMAADGENTIQNENPQEPERYDPFDVSRLRLTQDFVSTAGVKKILNNVPVRKPSKEWFIRTHPDPAYHINTAVIDLKEDGECYLVDRPLWDALSTESTFGSRALITTVNRQGVVFLWPIRLPDFDNRLDDWNRSALEAAQIAKDCWVRVQSNRSLGSYEVFKATGEFGAPQWDVPPFNELLRIAFRDRFIQDMDHLVLRRLRGEA